MTDAQRVDILLVEDTTTDAEMTLRALRKSGLGDYIVWVKDGSEALEFLFATGQYAGKTFSTPRLIMLDVKMPKVDGIEVLRRIMQDDATRLIPVVMLTSSAEERDVLDSYRLGANSYIVKPVEATEFVRVISDAGQYWTVMNRTPDFPPLPR